MKKIFVMILAAVMTCAILCSCGYNTYSFEKIGDVLESSTENVTFDEKVKLKAEIPSEDFLAATDYYFLFDDASGDYAKVLFKVDYTVTDLKIFNVEWPAAGSLSISPIKGDVVFAMRTLTPDKPLVIDVKLESVAIRGVSFVDPDGKTNYYTLASDALGGVVALESEMLDHKGVTAEAASSEFLNGTDGYILYEDSKAENTKLVYKLGSKVTNFRFLNIQPIDATVNDGKYKIVKVLKTIEELTEEKPFVGETAFSDGYPIRGISFVDEHGVTRYFTVNSDPMNKNAVYIGEVPPMAE